MMNTTSPGADIFVLLRGVLWRPWLVAGLTLIGTLISLAIAWLMPPVYQSTARILVESQQIPDALARSTITASAAERLAVIEQRLMTRSNLLEISHRLGLFDGRKDLSPTDRVEIIRDSTRIESISFNSNPRYRGPTQVSAFTISFESDDARRAAQVANEFVEMVLAQNLAARTARASETHDFFRAELERLGQELGSLEASIAQHKSQNKDHLPASMKLLLAERTALRQQMVTRAGRIARIETRSEEGEQFSASSSTVEIKPEQVAFNLITTGQLELLRRKQRVTQDRIATLQTAIDRTTQVEMELNAMQRKFDLVKIQHKDALRKANEAATGEKLEDSRQAERFEVIESAQVPDATIAPRREFIAIGGALASLSLAVGFAGLLEWLSRVLRNGADCQRLLNVRPVVIIPSLPSRQEVRQVRSQRFALGIFVLLTLGLGLWLSPFDMPKPALFEFDLSERLKTLESLVLASGVN